MILDCRETLTFYEVWWADDFYYFWLYRNTDILSFMKSDVLMIFAILDRRESWHFMKSDDCVDDFYDFWL